MITIHFFFFYIGISDYKANVAIKNNFTVTQNSEHFLYIRKFSKKDFLKLFSFIISVLYIHYNSLIFKEISHINIRYGQPVSHNGWTFFPRTQQMWTSADIRELSVSPICRRKKNHESIRSHTEKKPANFVNLSRKKC